MTWTLSNQSWYAKEESNCEKFTKENKFIFVYGNDESTCSYQTTKGK